MRIQWAERVSNDESLKKRESKRKRIRKTVKFLGHIRKIETREI